MRLLALCSNPDLPEAALLIGLRGHGVEVHCALEAQASARSKIESALLPTYNLKCKARIDLKGAIAVRSLIKQLQPDLIYAFTARTLSAATLGGIGISIPIVAYRGTMGNIKRHDPSSWVTWLNPKVRKIFCVSEAVRNDLSRIFPSEKLVTIHKGHQLDWYAGITPFSRAELGVADGATVICCTANMRPLKGVDVLLRAVAKISTDTPVHLLLVGEVRDRQLAQLAALVPPPHKVVFTGYSKEALRYTAASQIFVLPSVRREGFPKAVIEAIALGSVPVVSDVGGMPEIVSDGVTGRVVPPADSQSLAAAIAELISDPANRAKMKERGQGLFEGRLAIERTVEKTAHELMELFGEGQSARRPSHDNSQSSLTK